MKKKDEEHYTNTRICRFREKALTSQKVEDLCHLTG